MDRTQSLIEVEYDEKQKKNVIIKNWIKMLFNRNWITGNLAQTIQNTESTFNDNDVVTVKGVDTTYTLKFLFRKISSVRKDDDIEDFLDNNRKNYKFFVVSNISNKAQKQLLENSNVEVFTDDELLENIIDNILVPEHIVLSETEAQEYRNEYKIKNSDIPRIFTTDPIAKYYNIKPGQLVKIIRPSLTSGEEVALRICVPGQII